MKKKQIVLGVDIGGTNTQMGYVDRDGILLAQQTMPTEADRPAEEFFIRFHDEAEKLFRSVEEIGELCGIGLGAPNGNYYKGTIEQPPNLSWKFVNVAAELRRWYSVPVVLTNDANAAALGEMMFGTARGVKDFIMITLGTGVGSGFVANGRLIYGHDGYAGEIGHTVVDPHGRPCGCGKLGCLETYASANGLRRTVDELMHTTALPSPLRKISFERLTSKQVYEAAVDGDPLALRAFDDTGRTLGMKLADAVAITSPQMIVLFGGLAAAGDFILKPTKKYMEEYLFPIFRNKIPLVPSALPKSTAAILGASALIWNELDAAGKK
jgi:glucokinase